MKVEEIRDYWEERAAGDDSAQSTTQDVFLREIELGVLTDQIGKHSPQRVADVGCGDGRTTVGLARQFGTILFTGFDYAAAMVANARKVVSSARLSHVAIQQRDVREPLTESFDLIYTTRCLINLPSWDIQKLAIRNIHAALNAGGVYLMIENFVEGHDNFNQLRKLYGLPDIPIRPHNVFFARPSLHEFANKLFTVAEEVNISSTYYLVSRIVYSKLCADSGVTPNYLDEHHRHAAKLPFCGEYGPVRFISFIKR